MYYCWILKKGKPHRYDFVKAASWPKLKQAVVKEIRKADSLKWGFVEYVRDGKRTMTTFGWNTTLRNWPEDNPFNHVLPQDKKAITLPMEVETKLHPLKRDKAPSPREKKPRAPSPTKAKRPARSKPRR